MRKNKINIFGRVRFYRFRTRFLFFCKLVYSHLKYNGKATFKNGTFYGDFTATASGTLHKRGDGLKKYSLKGHFSEGGLPDSLWVSK